MAIIHLGRAHVGTILIIIKTVFILCLIGSSLILLNALNQLKVGGPIYAQTKNASDMIADILPPPLYLIETYLTVEKLNGVISDDKKEVLKRNLARLEKDFFARQKYWDRQDISPEIRNVLDNEVVPDGKKMLEKIHSSFLPAIDSGNVEGSKKALEDVVELYNAHRSAVDRLVTLAAVALNNAETLAATKKNSYLAGAYIVIGFSILMAFLGVVSLVILVVRPLRSVTNTLSMLADNNTNVEIGDVVGDGEIPSLWRAVISLRETVLEAKKLRIEQEELNQSLESRVHERTEELKLAKENADIANQAKSQFLSNISHELRTPMHAILSYSEMGLEKLENSEDQDFKRYLKNINISGERLLELLNNLLDLSKLEAGEIEVNMQSSDIHQALHHSLTELDSLIAQKKLNVKIINPDVATAIPILHDRNLMIQVFINILSNAIKFTPDEGDISIEYRNTGASLICSISNHGVNIPEGELEEIFQPFIQSSRTKTGAGGTGLGLAICREIVNAHNGKIWAENRGGWAVFHVMLPLEQPIKGGTKNE